MTISEIKATARERLDGKKKNAAIVIILFALVTGLISSIINKIFPGKSVEIMSGVVIKQSSTLASVIDYVVTLFFGLGLASYFMKITRGEEATFDEVFSKGKLLPKAIVISILAGILIALGFVALIIPGIILAYAYSMITYIYLDNPDIGITDALKKSREMMKGHKFEFFCLGLSFIGWIILGIFTLGILYLWLVPYMNVAQVCFYESIKGNKEEKDERNAEPAKEEPVVIEEPKEDVAEEKPEE